MSDWPQKFLHAFSELHHYDSVSAEHEELSLDDAYDIQHQFVALRTDTITGYKAALTSPAAQQAMGIKTPIVGVLFAEGEFAADEPILPRKQALLEVEFGFICANAIDTEVTRADVLTHMSACVPMVEVASPNLATKPNGLDLVATNSASYGYLLGETHAPDTDLDATPASLQRGSETLLTGMGNEVQVGQSQALAWLVNQVLQRGYRIEPGHVLMTGSIGGMCPAAPGDYVAEYGSLGSINFSIAETSD